MNLNFMNHPLVDPLNGESTNTRRVLVLGGGPSGGKSLAREIMIAELGRRMELLGTSIEVFKMSMDRSITHVITDELFNVPLANPEVPKSKPSSLILGLINRL